MDRSELESEIAAGGSTWTIAVKLKTSQTNVRHWLNKFGLTTSSDSIVFKCVHCGELDPAKAMRKGQGWICKSRCKTCYNSYTIARFNQYKLDAIAYKGGKVLMPCISIIVTLSKRIRTGIS